MKRISTTKCGNVSRVILVAFLMGLVAAPLVADTGLVTVSGYGLSDNQGPFLALGATYFLALRQEKYEETQLNDNLSFLSEQGFDFIRVLSMVGSPPAWSGKEILPPLTTLPSGGWSDYWAQYRQLVDRVYDTYGMRTQIVVFADGDYVISDPVKRKLFLQQLLTEVVAGREHKIMLIEVCNEYWQNGLTLEEVKEHGETLANATNVPVTLSAPAGGKTHAAEVYKGTSADIAVIHFSRVGGWDSVYDCDNIYGCTGCLAGLPARGSNNEPVGPGSSIYSEEDPTKILMAPAISWGSKLPMYVFHSRPGITADNKNLSPANQLSNPKSFRELFQKLGLGGGFNFLKNLLPGDLPSWTRAGTGWQANPFTQSANIDRSPASLSGSSIIAYPTGVADSNQTLTAKVSLLDVRVCSAVDKLCTMIGTVPQGATIRPRLYYNRTAFIITGTKGIVPPGETCNGVLDYRGDNCNALKRYQCGPNTDCQANSCTYLGEACYWMCHWEPGGSTCENTCDSKPFVPCSQRTSQGFCELGWGCYWGETPPPPPPSCKGTLDYRGENCNCLKRYQCGPGTDCEANGCTYQGAACYWLCHWEPGGSTCEDTCDAKAFVPCTQRTTEGFCNLGWGCYWE